MDVSIPLVYTSQWTLNKIYVNLHRSKSATDFRTYFLWQNPGWMAPGFSWATCKWTITSLYSTRLSRQVQAMSSYTCRAHVIYRVSPSPAGLLCTKGADDRHMSSRLVVVYWPPTQPVCQNRKCTCENNRCIRSRNIRIL